MAPNVSHLAFLSIEPVALPSLKGGLPVNNHNKDYDTPRTEDADAYWTWNSTPQVSNLFSANHITANLCRASSSLSSTTPATTPSHDTYWAEASHGRTTADHYWHEDRSVSTVSDDYWNGL